MHKRVKMFVLAIFLVLLVSGCTPRWGVVEIPVNGGTRQIVDLGRLPAWEKWEVAPTPCEQLAVDAANGVVTPPDVVCVVD